MFFNKTKLLKDSYIDRLRCSVIGEGMLHAGNPYLMDFAIKNMPLNGIVIEIGVYGGLSTNLLLYLLQKNDKIQKLYGCDAWVYEGYKDFTGIVETHIDGREDILRKDYVQYIKDSFLRSVGFLNKDNLPHTCHSTSDDFFTQWSSTNLFTDVFGRNFSISQKISFAYIDGDHSLEQTEKDFNNVAERLLIGGFVLIDDSADGMSFGSASFIKHIRKNPCFEIVTQNPNYLIKKIK